MRWTNPPASGLAGWSEVDWNEVDCNERSGLAWSRL